MARGKWLKANKSAEAAINKESAEYRATRPEWLEKNKAAEGKIKEESAEYRAKAGEDRAALKSATAAFKEKNVAPKMERARDRARVYFGLKKGETLPIEAESHAKVQGASEPTMPEKSFLK